MITISEVDEHGVRYYQAEVRSKKHSLQSARFTDRERAEEWANWLDKRIDTDEMLKGLKDF